MIAFGTIPAANAIAGILIQSIGAVPAVLCFAAVGIVLAILTALNPHVRAAKSALPESMPA